MLMKKVIPFLLILTFLLPIPVLAVDFTINETIIDAKLMENGNVEVSEQHTYEFYGDFNGVTREIVPKPGTEIVDFNAFEKDKELKAEKDGNLYKIHRSGDDETITVRFAYQIEGAAEKFQDGVEFYWPFFDDRNESDYENMTIAVHPPSPTDDVLFLGYEEAFETGLSSDDGSVVFKMGEVPEGRNGDIRVIYEPELFPGLAEQNTTVKDQLLADREGLENEAKEFAADQNTASSISTFVLPFASVLLGAMLLFSFMNSRRKKSQIKQHNEEFFVPEEVLSLPAAIYFTHSSFLSPNATAASLLELVRKALVKQHSEDHFELISNNADMPHEQTLIDLLFNKIGDGKHFKLSEMEEYTKKELNHSAYNDGITKWSQEVAAEVKEHRFREKKTGIRLMSAGLGVLSAALAIYTGIYGLMLMMAISIMLSLIAFSFSLFYSPLTVEGHTIKLQWKQMRKSMENLPASEWEKLNPDDKLRAYAYLLAVDEKQLEKKSQSFSLAGTYTEESESGSLYFNPLLLTGVFITANSNTSAHASSGSSVSAGGGVGGGGGGSGAF